MTYLNDRRVVETLTFPLAFSMVLVQGVSDEFADKKKCIHELLTDAMNGVIGTMEHRRRNKILKRCRDAMEKGYLNDALENRTHAAKVGLALYYFTNNMMQQDAFHFTEGSPFHRAIELILPALEEWAGKEAFDKSSFKYARRMLTNYQKAGYFKDVEWLLEY